MARSEREATRRFFNEMAPHYDRDLDVLGWDPVSLVRRWSYVVAPGASLLDCGCGTGALLAWYAGANRELAGMDLSDEMIRLARRRPELRDVSLHVAGADEEWPFLDASFDHVIALAMLEFVPALEESLDELGRVLKPGGSALFSVEDVVDFGGVERPRHEVRYGEFPLWRHDEESVEASLPPGLTVVRSERVRGYEVVEYGFVAAYRVFEVQKSFEG